MQSHPKSYIIGAVFGLITPFIGLFFGLQVSTVLGNFLAWPLVLVVLITEIPIGLWPSSILLAAVALSMVSWAVIFRLIAGVYKKMGAR